MRALIVTLALAVAACGDTTSTSELSSEGGGGVVLPRSVNAQPLPTSWARTAGDAKDDWALDVTSDAAGNVYVVGYFRTSIDFGAGALTTTGSQAAFVVSFAPDGSVRWSHAFTGAGYSEAWAVAIADGKVYVGGKSEGEVDFGAGATTGDRAFVASLAADTGMLDWAVRFGTQPISEIRSVAVGGGLVYALGSFDGSGMVLGSMLTNAGQTDVLLAALDTSGAAKWARAYGSSGVDEGHALALTSAGEPVITGTMASSIDFGAGAVGATNDAFLVGLTADGKQRYALTVAGDGPSRGNDVAIDAMGNVYFAGEFRGSAQLAGLPLQSAGASDVLLASFDPSGAPRFMWRFGDVRQMDAGGIVQSGVDTAQGITVGGDGNVYLTGSFQLTIDFGGGPMTYAGGGGDQDAFVASFDTEGNHRWSKKIGGSRGDIGWAAAGAPDGSLTVVGRSASQLDVGTGALPNAGGDDVMIVRLGP